jgi:hypothetical protein
MEEAVHLVRGAPAAAWATYLAGVTPWFLGLAWFWASSSWFSPRPAELLWWALGLALLYLWLKTMQAAFCARLRARRLGQPAPELGARALGRIAARQAGLQGWAVPVLPVAVLLTVPAGVTWMFFENATALAATEEPAGDTLGRRAAREARRWPGPAHIALLLFSGLWLCVWINVASTFYVVPYLARSLLGLDNLFALSGWSGFNTTFLALVTAFTWLAVDPLVKSYHVLRTFYGEARLTGEDLRLEIQRGPSRGSIPGRTIRAVVVLFAAGLMAGLAPGAGGLRAEDASAPAVVTPAEVDAALDTALAEREFRWRLEPMPVADTEEGQDGPIKAFVRAGVDWTKQIARDIGDLVGRVRDWFDGLTGDKKKTTPKPLRDTSPRDYTAITRVLLYFLLGVCLVALVWVLWVGWKQQRRPAPRALAAAPAAVPPPDLNDEKLEASRLPTDEWLALARAQMALGEWRLALRALYLATLAGLGAQGLVTLARAKTNLDYERELTRRAAGQDALVAGFSARRLSFERVWYGRDTAAEPEVRAWLAELERVARPEQGGRGA